MPSHGNSRFRTETDMSEHYADPSFDDDGMGDETVAASVIRARNLRDIHDLYGTEEGIGREMLMQVASKYLLDMLPDAAISELAELHRFHDRRQSRCTGA